MNNGGRNTDARFIGGKGRTSTRNQITCDVTYQVNQILTSGGTSMAQRMLTPANHFPPDEINLPKIIPCKPQQRKPSFGSEDGAKGKLSMPPPTQPPPPCLRTGSTLSGNTSGLYGTKGGNSSHVFIIRTNKSVNNNYLSTQGPFAVDQHWVGSC